jgi:hypothetical protein
MKPSATANARLNRLKKRLRNGTFWGKVNFGSFSQVEPISRDFGFDRGLPIDRYYIENFLKAHAADIRGRVLEIGDASYCRQFGGDRIERQEVLHVHEGAPEATIIGDLSQPGILPADSLDCAVLTQTLHLIYDMKAALIELRRGMKPGGVVLATVPGITPVARDEWGATWYWTLTRMAAERLFGEVFGPANVTVEQFGNAFAATAFVQGVATEDVSRAKLDVVDEQYPVIVAVRAVRGG